MCLSFPLAENSNHLTLLSFPLCVRVIRHQCLSYPPSMFELSAIHFEFSAFPFELSATPFEFSAIPFEFSAIPFEFSAMPFEFSANRVRVFRNLFLSFRNQHSNFPLTLLSFLPSKFKGKGKFTFLVKSSPWKNIVRNEIITEMSDKIWK